MYGRGREVSHRQVVERVLQPVRDSYHVVGRRRHRRRAQRKGAAIERRRRRRASSSSANAARTLPSHAAGDPPTRSRRSSPSANAFGSTGGVSPVKLRSNRTRRPRRPRRAGTSRGTTSRACPYGPPNATAAADSGSNLVVRREAAARSTMYSGFVSTVSRRSRRRRRLQTDRYHPHPRTTV